MTKSREDYTNLSGHITEARDEFRAPFSFAIMEAKAARKACQRYFQAHTPTGARAS
jgi:hypothetical protein